MSAKIVWALLIIGGLNWGLVGAFNFDLVATIFGSVVWLQDLVYILVGIAALVTLAGGCKCKKCADGGCKPKMCCGGKKEPMSTSTNDESMSN